jgi:hypothetical protein
MGREREPRLFSILIYCREEHCRNFQVIHPDSELPKVGEWTCQTCEDALEEQMTNELARREDSKVVPS